MLCEFTVRNTNSNDTNIRLFEAINTAFQRLAEPSFDGQVAAVLGVCFVTLQEFGLMPDYSQNAECQEHINKLTEFAIRKEILEPDYSHQTWVNLADWTKKLMLEYAELEVPKGWNLFVSP